MDDSKREIWQEIRNGLSIAVKIISYSFISLGVITGVAYIYVTCCQ